MQSNDQNGFKLYLAYLWAWRNTFIIIGFPMLLLPLCFCFSYDPTLVNPMRCAYVILLMVIFWTTESLPLPITALLPMVLYPLMMLIKATELAPQYMSESNISFVGSIIVINAFEKAGLHKRFALKVLTLVGAQPRWLLAGFMITSWFLSMWCSNTMTTILLVPIVRSVTAELRDAMEEAVRHHEQHQPTDRTAIAMEKMDKTSVANQFEEQVTPDLRKDVSDSKYENMLLLAIAYSASIGGTATLIGTGPNLIMKAQVEATFSNKTCTSPINFLNWMEFAVPMSFTFLILLWVWILIYYMGPLYTFGCKKSTMDAHRDKVQMVVKKIYDDLPPIHFEQVVVLVHCIVMILLLVTRQLSTQPLIGWEVIAPDYVKESTATILCALSLFIFPIALPKRDPVTGKISPPKISVDWAETERNFPFGLILLIGGGMAAAYGADKTGLAKVLAELLNQLIEPLDDYTSLIIILTFMVFVTEFMSNTACVTLMMPILSELANIRGVNPMLFMYPTALAASFAFMFPVATPPNAIIFQTGRFKIVDMISAGFVVNLIGIGVIFAASISLGDAIFHLTQPAWIKNNITMPDGSFHVNYTCIYY